MLQGGTFANEEDLRSDPTIKAMLHMLDLIYEKTINKDINKLINRLQNLTFYLFDMGKFELGEELYIKMNARGKQLSKYENLKAFIEKSNELHNNQEICTKIDTTWSDYFFLSNGKCKPDEFDTKGKNFLHYAAIFFRNLDNSIKEYDIKELIEDTNRVVDSFYEVLQNLDYIQILDSTINLANNFDILLFAEELKIKDSSFFSGDKSTLKLKEILYFFSILSYIKNSKNKLNLANNDCIKMLDDYLRVCKHFIENHRLDNPEYIKPFIQLFEKLSSAECGIYEFLCENPTHEFNSSFYSQEVRKAKLIIQSRNSKENWEAALQTTSDDKFLIGWVDFLLDFSDEKYSVENYQNKIEFKNPNLAKFNQYANLTMRIFGDDFFNKKECFSLFQRALLCMGNYSFRQTNYFYGTCSKVTFRDREMWHWLLNGERLEWESICKKRAYFKDLLDSLLEMEGDLVGKLKTTINNTNLLEKKWWEQILIKNGEMFDFLNENRNVASKSSRIRLSAEHDKVELLSRPKSTKNVRDLFDYGFYIYCQNKDLKLSDYDYDGIQSSTQHRIKSHFSINDKEVWCDNAQQKLYIGENKFQINFNTNIFEEFEKVISQITN